MRVPVLAVLLAAIMLFAADRPAEATPIDNIASDSFGEPGAISLPADDGAHDGVFVEWWQWWLHLRAKNGDRFGATVVFFHFPLDTAPGQAGAAPRRTDVRITDASRQRVVSDSQWSAGDPVAKVPNGFDLSDLGQTARGGNGRDRLHLELEEYAADLRVRARREPVLFFNEAGFIRTDPVESARLYERQRMKATGRLTRDGRRFEVTGSSWFEHGWGNIPNVVTYNWDFFHLELDDGRDVQVARVRRAPGSPVFLWEGTIRDKRAQTRYLEEGDFELEPRGTWARDDGSCTYPSDWRIRLGDETLRLIPMAEDQEVRNPIYGHYWDGNVRIEGDVTGRGVAEHLNYCVTP